MRDISVDDLSKPAANSIYLRRSKTDQIGKGVMVHPEKMDQDICPVASLLAYLAIMGSSNSPLFRWSEERALTKQEFVEKIRFALGTLGMDESLYAGHNFRPQQLQGVALRIRFYHQTVGKVGE